ncbi:MAG: Na/Pi cotransporter family protein [Synergistaceae bacterium]|jgi:phosphate:Na+ symporter|nr:Na/Pi cotransporter family protein [Synergistaceae bacterium]
MSVALQLAGGVGLFLYAIKLMSEALQFIAGDRMRQLVGTLTRTPIRGVFVGIVVTILIQSSSGTTVMTVSFVNAGLMTLGQAIGVIMGANIGTTVTAQIIAFRIENMALPFIAIGVVLCLFGRSKRQRYAGNGIVGFGLLFLGMETMENATSFLAARQDFFAALSGFPLWGLLAGMALTMVVQSSAATIGLTMAMATKGLLTLDAAIPIILGDNIGTTITAVLASIGTNRSAKQAAAAHVLFNLIGSAIFLLFLPQYKSIVLATSDDIARQLANAHTLFNVVNTVIFLPFTQPFARLIQRLIPAEPVRVPEGPIYLDPKLLHASSAAAVRAVKDELMHMGSITLRMSAIVRTSYMTGTKGNGEQDEGTTSPFDELEEAVDAINAGISRYASEIWQKGLSGEVSTVLGCYVNASGDLERVGDHLENLMELCGEGAKSFSDAAEAELWDMYDTVEKALAAALDSVDKEDTSEADMVIIDLEQKIDWQEKTYRHNHIERLNRGECNPERGVVFIDILSNLERIGDHSNNIAGAANDIAALSIRRASSPRGQPSPRGASSRPREGK